MSRRRILVVEDEIIIAWDLKRMLEELDAEVLPIAARADQAVEMARTLVPDIILMDILLKGDRNGIDAAREIRGFSGKPIFFLTGNAHILDEPLIRILGIRGVYPKPTSERHIREILDSVESLES